MKRLILIAMMAIVGAWMACKGETYVVTDNYVTVYGEPNRINNLGRLNHGEKFESDEADGSMLVFNFKGRRAYVASYCCKKVQPETAPVAKKAAATKQKAKVEPETGVETEIIEDVAVEELPSTSCSPSRSNSIDSVGDTAAGVVGLVWFGGGFVLFIWLLANTNGCINFFNNMAGAYVAEYWAWKNLRPLILLFVIGLASNLGSTSTVIAAVVIYEAIVLLIRAKHFHSLRAALVEALYLAWWIAAALALLTVMLILALLGSGGSGSSGRKGRKSGGSCCADCRSFSGNNDHTGYCSYHGTTVNRGDCCSHCD